MSDNKTNFMTTSNRPSLERYLASASSHILFLKRARTSETKSAQRVLAEWRRGAARSNSKVKRSVRSASDHEASRPLVSIGNFLSSGRPIKAYSQPPIVFDRFRTLQAAAVFGLNESDVTALRDDGHVIIPNEEITLKLNEKSKSDDASDGDSIDPAQLTLIGLSQGGKRRARGAITGKGIRIGMIDTGINPLHKEFRGADLIAADASGFRVSVANEPRGDVRHGTHVASLVIGQSIGVAPKARLAFSSAFSMAANKNGEARSDYIGILRSLDWLLGEAFSGEQPQILVCCFGYTAESNRYHPLITEQIDKYSRELQIAFLAGTGNTGSALHVHLPAALHSVISIGAVNSAGDHCRFSDHDQVDPKSGGNPFVSCIGEDCLGADGATDEGYRTASGTSQACAIAGGVVALLTQFNGITTITAESARALLAEAVKPAPAPAQTRVGIGLIDLSRVIEAAAGHEH